MWVEVKHMSMAPMYFIGGYCTTGVKTRLLEHYRAIEKASGIHCCLVFAHDGQI